MDGAQGCEDLCGSPISRRHQSSAANSLSNCGGDQRPPHRPAAGRRSTSTATRAVACRSRRSAAWLRASRAARFCLRLGNSAWRPSSAATQSAAHRTHRAGRVGAAAHGRAQIHDGLGVGARPLSSACRPPLVPTALAITACGTGIPGNAEHPRQHPLDVAVQNRMPLPARQRQNRARRGSADAGQRHHRLEILRETRRRAARPALARRPASSAPVRSTPSPVHRCSTSSSGAAASACDVGKARHEALVVRDHRGHLGLLQHDLGDPHPVGRGIHLPRQIVPAVHCEPGEQPLGELLVRRSDFAFSVLE